MKGWFHKPKSSVRYYLARLHPTLLPLPNTVADTTDTQYPLLSINYPDRHASAIITYGKRQSLTRDLNQRLVGCFAVGILATFR
eukprot:791239-Pyramimonas_sp.AAC.2